MQILFLNCIYGLYLSKVETLYQVPFIYYVYSIIYYGFINGFTWSITNPVIYRDESRDSFRLSFITGNTIGQDRVCY